MCAFKKVYTADPGLFVNIQRLDVTKIETYGLWGILAELSVFLHLKNYTNGRIYYYRERDKEVDFVIDSTPLLIPIEVKYLTETIFKWGKRGIPGIFYFMDRFQTKRTLVISRDHLQLDDQIMFVPLRLFLS